MPIFRKIFVNLHPNNRNTYSNMAKKKQKKKQKKQQGQQFLSPDQYNQGDKILRQHPGWVNDN